MTILSSSLISSMAADFPVTPDDLLKLDQHGLFELVDGHLIEKPMGYLAGVMATEVTVAIKLYLRANPIGGICSETTFQCFSSEANRVRRPDLAFIRSEKLRDVPDEGHVKVRPDLAIEIVSPGDGVYELDDKLLDYEEAGIPLTWVFNPSARIVRIYRPGQPIRTLRESDVLDGGDVLPGFSSRLGDLFPPSKPAG